MQILIHYLEKSYLVVKKTKGTFIVRQTVTAATAESIRRRIFSGDFKEGQSLLQDTLAAEYGVSRIPLREALRQLESEGLVTSIPHRGYAVTVLTMEEIVEHFDIRALLEIDVLKRAIPNQKEEHFEQAQQILDHCATFKPTAADNYDWGELNWEFHSILYEPSNRPRTLKLISSLHHGPDRLVRGKAALANGFEQVQAEHAEILKLCRQKDVTGAIKLLEEHILNASDVLVSFMQKAKAENGND